MDASLYISGSFFSILKPEQKERGVCVCGVCVWLRQLGGGAGKAGS